MRHTSYGRRHCNRDFMPVSRERAFRLASLLCLIFYSDYFANLEAPGDEFFIVGIKFPGNDILTVLIDTRDATLSQIRTTLRTVAGDETARAEKSRERKSVQPTDYAHAYRRGVRKSTQPISARDGTIVFRIGVWIWIVRSNWKRLSCCENEFALFYQDYLGHSDESERRCPY